MEPSRFVNIVGKNRRRSSLSGIHLLCNSSRIAVIRSLSAPTIPGRISTCFRECVIDDQLLISPVVVVV